MHKSCLNLVLVVQEIDEVALYGIIVNEIQNHSYDCSVLEILKSFYNTKLSFLPLKNGSMHILIMFCEGFFFKLTSSSKQIIVF